MKPKSKRVLKTALIVTVSAVLLLAAAGPILARVFRNKIQEKLEAANVHVSSVSINLFNRSLTLRGVQWKKDLKEAEVDIVSIRGIGIIPLISSKQISIRKIILENGRVSITRDTATVKQEPKADSIKFSSIDVDRITLKDIDVIIKNDTTTEFQAKVGVVVHYLFIKDPKEYRDPSAYTFRNLETTINDLKIQKAGGLSAFEIKELKFDKELKTLHIDSLKLYPVLNKDKFAKAVKSSAATWTLLNIKSIDASGVNMGIHMADTSLMVKSLTIDGAFIHAYKNKKYPFDRSEKFPLPMEAFQKVPWGIEVDSVKIKNSAVKYEELPTNGFHTAHIIFDEIEATMSAFNNREFKNLSGISTLVASAKVMKTGTVKATFKLPLQKTLRYTAEGSIRNIPLRELNPLLSDLAFVEIESGRLNKLNFNFTYDDAGSTGELDFDYENLKILGLKKTKDKDLDRFKTLLVNTAVKNDQTLAGAIDVKRNKNKAVFNLWTISIVDGIRNSVLPGKKNKSKKKGN